MSPLINKMAACLSACIGIGGGCVNTAGAGVTLVITVSDARGSETLTVSSATSNQVSYNNTGINPGVTTTGTPGIINDFLISTSTDSNAPGSGTNDSNTTNNTTKVDFIGNSSVTSNNTAGSTATVSISVFPTDFTSPGGMGSLLYVDSIITTSTPRASQSAIGFMTSVAQDPSATQSTGTFTPGYQVLPRGGATFSEVASPFVRSGSSYRLYNTATFFLNYDNANKAVATSGTSTVTSDVHSLGVTPTPAIATPEPGTLALAIAGLPLVGIMAWRRRRSGSSS